MFQGDQEKLAGRLPIPLMDRDKESELAEMQVKMHSPLWAPSPCPQNLFFILNIFDARFKFWDISE